MTGARDLPLVAHELAPGSGFTLVPAPVARDWMSATPEGFARRCLPLLVANQSGWLVLNNAAVRCRWDHDGIDGVRVDYPGVAPAFRATSHFGTGIVTWNLPYLFRTPPGYDLLARGPANAVKDGVTPLEGIIETDRTAATFTVNWKLTRTRTWVTFDRDEPLCMLVPHRRDDLERFAPEIRPIAADPLLDQSHARWSRSRAEFLRGLGEPGSAAWRSGWQRDYLRGRTGTGEQPDARRTRVRLRPFTEQAPPAEHPRPVEPVPAKVVDVHPTAVPEPPPPATGHPGPLLREGWVPPAFCRRLVAAYGSGMVSGRLPRPSGPAHDLPLALVTAGDRELAEWTRLVRDEARHLLAEELGLPGLVADYSALMCLYEGGAHVRHADNVTADGAPNHTHWREATAMIYLDDGERDFTGGRLRFARLGREVVARPGLLVGFGCGADLEHEVSTVRRGRRHAMAFWFTRDPARQECW